MDVILMLKLFDLLCLNEKLLEFIQNEVGCRCVESPIQFPVSAS